MGIDIFFYCFSPFFFVDQGIDFKMRAACLLREFQLKVGMPR